jgi:hypothetical protein
MLVIELTCYLDSSRQHGDGPDRAARRPIAAGEVAA